MKVYVLSGDTYTLMIVAGVAFALIAITWIGIIATLLITWLGGII